MGDLAALHEAKAKTPTMGGLLIFGSVLFSTILWAEPNIYVITAMVIYIILTIVGFADDFLKISKKNSKGLAGRYKLFGQLLATGVALFFLLGPFSENFTGTQERNLESSLLEVFVVDVPDVETSPPIDDVSELDLAVLVIVLVDPIESSAVIKPMPDDSALVGVTSDNDPI